MLPQFVDDLFHLKGSHDGLNEDCCPAANNKGLKISKE